MNIIVIGDIMLDINNTAEVTRRAPEADIPIYNILDTSYILGGAANVAQNLKNLGTNVEIISVGCDDSYETKIKDLFNFKQIKCKLFCDKERKTTQKHRIFLNDTLHVRYDIETTHEISDDIEDDIIDYVTKKENIDAIIISDYDKGVITEYLSQTIISFANKKNIPTFVDPKIKNYMKYKDCFLFKTNQNESEIITGEKSDDKILNFIKKELNCKNILITKGKEGMILNNIHNKITHDNIINLVDVTGAGDVVLSVLVYVYLKTIDILEASKVANYIAGKSVNVLGNYIVSLKDIDDYSELHKLSHENKIIHDTEIDKIIEMSKYKNIVFTNGCFDILHSAHIQLLKFAKLQGNKLVVGLNSDESIKRLKGETRPINDIHERSTILSLFDFIDYIIVFNDDTPLNVIKMLKPSIIVKGSDYNKEHVIGKELVEDVVLFNFVQNKSSTNIISKIKNN